MDIVTELAARGTAYLLLLQDAWLRPAGAPIPDELFYLRVWLPGQAPLRDRALALVRSAQPLPGHAAPPTDHSAAGTAEEHAAFEQAAARLLLLLRQCFTANTADPDQRKALAQTVLRPPQPGQTLRVLTPEQWRRQLRAWLYAAPGRRAELTQALGHLPTLAHHLLPATPAPAASDPAAPTSTTADPANPAPPLSPEAVRVLGLTDAELAEALDQAGCPVPFEVLFGRELAALDARRLAVTDAQEAAALAMPAAAPGAAVPAEAPPGAVPAAPDAADDPVQRAWNRQLLGVALSGGGIRSATFNLGLLQGLARAGWLPRVDYLSTVSGGGYVGSWLVAWIMRAGSLRQVAARLCPDLAPQPNAEEVRPIRWLRMYSNYLAPQPGFLAADSWTMALTWLRNTLLNQLILMLALGGVLAFSSLVVCLWLRIGDSHGPHPVTSDSWWHGLPAVTVFLVVALLVGRGMQHYYRSTLRQPAAPDDAPPRTGQRQRLTLLLLAVVMADLISWYFYHFQYSGFWPAVGHLWLVGLSLLLGLLGVAALGRYDRCFYPSWETDANEPAEGEAATAPGAAAPAPPATPAADGFRRWWRVAGWPWFWLLVTSAAASTAGVLALAGAWWGLSEFYLPCRQAFVCFITSDQAGALAQPPFYLGFALGPPLVLEALVLVVLVRMALLGRNFPDERREWWGRLGADLHRGLLTWLLLFGAVTLARRLALTLGEANLSTELTGLLVGTSWLGLVGKAVQLAFSARTPAQRPERPGQRGWSDYLLLVAPYLFGLGLLLLVSSGFVWLLRLPEWPLPWLHLPAPAGGQPDVAAALTVLAGRSLLLLLLLGGLAMLLGWRVGVNDFSLHHFYRNRLTRAYLGASRPRHERHRTANPYTNFDRRDDLKLSALRYPDPQKPAEPGYQGPYLLVNATLNATKTSDLARQDRQAESFVFTPLYCGFDFVRIRAVRPGFNTHEFGYRPTRLYGYGGNQGPGLGTAMAISGAAANPNEGYHSSPATAFLLTLFNVRLGWWMGNPSAGAANVWQRADPTLGLLYLAKDLLGRSSSSDNFVNLSDGGHFDNMGVYELVRRRCRFIILGDAEEDHLFTCEGLANAIRRCRVDFGVEIRLDVTPITTRDKNRHSARAYAVGTIHYPDYPDEPGYLLYVKAALNGREPADVREYGQYNEAFPHQSTGDQFFNEAQFESYRRLGLHIADTLLADAAPPQRGRPTPPPEAVLPALWQRQQSAPRPPQPA